MWARGVGIAVRLMEGGWGKGKQGGRRTLKGMITT